MKWKIFFVTIILFGCKTGKPVITNRGLMAAVALPPMTNLQQTAKIYELLFKYDSINQRVQYLESLVVRLDSTQWKINNGVASISNTLKIDSLYAHYGHFAPKDSGYTPRDTTIITDPEIIRQ